MKSVADKHISGWAKSKTQSKWGQVPEHWSGVWHTLLTRRREILCDGGLAGWRRQWHPTPVLLPGKSHGWRSLECCSPWDRWGLVMTECLFFHFSLGKLGKEMATHSSVLAWRIPGTGEPGGLLSMGSQSRTRLKWLSSSRSAGNNDGTWLPRTFLSPTLSTRCHGEISLPFLLTQF